MTDSPDNLDPKLEQLLRQWGAKQARDDAADQLDLRTYEPGSQAEQAVPHAGLPIRKSPASEPPGGASSKRHRDANIAQTAGETPATQGPVGIKPGTLHIVLRWAPLAAAAVMLIAAAWLYINSGRPHEQAADKGIASRMPNAIAAEAKMGLDQRLAKLQAERDQALAALRQMRAATTQQAGLQRALTVAQQAAEKAHAELGKAQADKKVLTDQVNGVNDRLAELDKRLTKSDADRVLLEGQRDKLLASTPRVQDRLDAAVAELTATRKQFEQAQQDAAKVQEEIALLKIRNAELAEQTRNLYLGALAGDERGLAGARVAVVKSRILQRLAAARKQASPDSLQLVDGLEVVLMRLSTLEAQDPIQVASFRKLMADSKIAAALERALAAKPPATLGQLLREAQIIITEAQREA